MAWDGVRIGWLDGGMGLLWDGVWIVIRHELRGLRMLR
jgi:hypothetical protein